MVHDFLKYKSNIYSQNGEDGIIEQIFKLIGTETKLCCEFGAWDGIHLSNVRNLILNGWSGIVIEGDKDRYKQLAINYHNNEKVFCINEYIDTEHKLLTNLLRDHLFSNLDSMDFLSIDVDGLDYDIFETLDFQPRIICIEVNAGHDPKSSNRIARETAKNNIGQPLAVFTELANNKGYELMCYNGNAFFGRKDVLKKYTIDGLSSEIAYKNFLDVLTKQEKEWLWQVNEGWVEPHYKFRNPFLRPNELHISYRNIMKLKARYSAIYLKALFARFTR